MPRPQAGAAQLTVSSAALRTLMAALAPSRASTDRSLPASQARKRGVAPERSRASTTAPRRSRACTREASPSSAAACSGVARPADEQLTAAARKVAASLGVRLSAPLALAAATLRCHSTASLTEAGLHRSQTWTGAERPASSTGCRGSGQAQDVRRCGAVAGG